MYLIFAVLAVEGLALASTPHSTSLLGPVAPVGIVWFAVFLALGYGKIKAMRDELPFGVAFLAAHFISIVAVYVSQRIALHTFHDVLFFSTTAHLMWTGLTLLSVGLLIFACIPLRAWKQILAETRWLWLYASIAGALAWCLRFPFQKIWDAPTTAPGRVLQVITFDAVQHVLRIFLPDVAVDAARFRIGTSNFAIIVAEQCSGLEGLGLVLVFTTLWLLYFRRESRFPQALLLVPAALMSVWVMNILRICALVLIGNTGAHDVAMVGFHSQAGWIAFTSVAFAFSMATRKLRWVRRMPDASRGEDSSLAHSVKPNEVSGESPATSAYLTPFLAILAAGFISKAASGYFEWLYPLRFVAAAAAIWIAWPEIKKLNWRFGWAAPLTGAAIFAIWIVPSIWTGTAGQSAANSIETGLASLSPQARVFWIIFRVAAAVITVPIAEELAFRGYLARRIMAREFELISFQTLTVISIGVSSLTFGLMHGAHWMVGTIAGVAFAALLRWRGRMGDAIVAHATSNLLLAIWVLSRGEWAQW